MGHAARLFNGAAEQTLYGRVTPTEEQREFLQAQWNALADYLKTELVGWGYPISTWLQGSYKYGTLIKPVRKGEEYDVDLGIYFEWGSREGTVAPAAQQLRDWVQSALLKYSDESSELTRIDEPARERCSRASYEKRFHIDTPTYHWNAQTDRRRLACLSGVWEDSDPKAFYQWFKNAVGIDNRDLLRRLVRYLKAWAAISFEEAPDSRPSSIMLTVVVTEAFQAMWGARLFGTADDDALVRVVEAIYERLVQSRCVKNPVDDSEDLNRVAENCWDGFLTRLSMLHGAAQAAAKAEDETAAAFAWGGAFSFLMPLPEADEVEVVDGPAGRALMQIPEIQVQVFDKNDKLLATYANEVAGIGKNFRLAFSIKNRAVMPGFSSVEWTVRNDGAEAEYLGDLGHVRGGIGMFSVDEHTKYAGKQYMDCVIRNNGVVLAARRVPVYIKDDPRQIPQQLGNRNWIRLRTGRGWGR